MNHASRLDQLHDLLARRILVLDGAMGTLIQAEGLTEEDCRGIRFRGHPKLLKGMNDLLVLTQPAIIEKLHRLYLEAGADIIETNTFSATLYGVLEFGLEEHVFEINKAAAEVARRAADAVTRLTPDRP